MFSDITLECCLDLVRLLASAILWSRPPHTWCKEEGAEKMAEVVNRILESMLPELEELQRAGLFNEEEVR